MTDHLLVAAVVGVALITLQLISLGTPLLSSVTGPTQRMDQGAVVSNQLRNHDMCGITTGGQVRWKIQTQFKTDLMLYRRSVTGTVT